MHWRDSHMPLTKTPHFKAIVATFMESMCAILLEMGRCDDEVADAVVRFLEDAMISQ